MRVLFTTRGSSGHVGPLAPFAHACLRAGHEVVVSAQRQFERNVTRSGLPFSPVDEPARDEWMPLMAKFATFDIDTADGAMISQFFAGLDLRAELPALRALVASWRPDVIVRESWEFGSTLVAELHQIPIVRVGLGLAEASFNFRLSPLYLRPHFAASVAASERKMGLPSEEPSRSSHARSGCGISPSTLRSREQMPAMWSREPLMFDSSPDSPAGSQ